MPIEFYISAYYQANVRCIISVKKHRLRNFMLSLLFAILLACFTYLVFTFALFEVTITILVVAFLTGILSALILLKFCPNLAKKLVTITAILCAASFVMFVSIKLFSASAVYKSEDGGKETLFSDKKVLIVVPHQDDELNLMSGAIEEYINYGSEVYVMYATNGDYRVTCEQRLNEAIDALECVGVDEEHIIFLGYGDSSYDENGKHLYNSDGVASGSRGDQKTFALDDHPAFREGRDYTRDNIREDLRDAVLELKPDVIYAVDCDAHPDHKMTALTFDRAMGEILQNDTEYRPLVYKGFAYSTAYNAVPDFYSLNILSTQEPTDGLSSLAPQIFDWDSRFRLPVDSASLSRSVYSSRIYSSARQHASQDEDERCTKVINGDKVFWQRETESILYSAEVSASSGDASLVCDFVLADSSDVRDKANNLTGVWLPLDDDSERSLTVKFAEEQNIDRIKLYDNPAADSNVLNAVLTFDDGMTVDTGALDPMGAETEIEVNKVGITSFTLTLTDTEGEHPGLTEIEAYSEPFTPQVSFIKLMNSNSDFVYDYFIDASGVESFSLYSYGCSSDPACYEISCNGEGCSAVINGDVITVTCPSGKSCELTISDGTHSDTVFLHNKNRTLTEYFIKLESGSQTFKDFGRQAQEYISDIKLILRNGYNIKLYELQSWLAQYGIYIPDSFYL